MRILFAAVIGALIVAALQLGSWLFAVALPYMPPGIAYLGMLPGIAGVLMLWRAFKNMEQPVAFTGMFYGLAVLRHHRKEFNASLAALVLLAMANKVFGYMLFSAAHKTPGLLALEAFTGLSLVTAAGLTVAAWLRVNKASLLLDPKPVAV